MLTVESLNINPKSFMARRTEWNCNIGIIKGGRGGAGSGAWGEAISQQQVRKSNSDSTPQN